MHWFQANAPIRLKMMVVVLSFVFLVATSGIASSLIGGVQGVLCSVGFAAAALGLGLWYRHAICFPYVSTVVRMEGLAAGDLDAPIQFTDYRDCVGRMTKAMFAFRDTAAEQRAHAREQSKAVSLLGEKLQALSKGDLTADIDADFQGSYAALKADFNTAIQSLRTVIASVAASARDIETGSMEITHASEDLARRTESNAASLEQTAAAVTQMDGRLKETAAAANQTVLRADQTKETVSSGRLVANEAVTAMGRVSESAKGIDSVIEGLDKIAFQTRVLAMNAAVEAGRAGEAGRGFAVVADLVSALAMRAEEEAKRARDQLTVTQADVVTAVAAVERVDGALQDISSDVEQVHQLLATIATENAAQAGAITEINAAVASMDRSTQQNAAMVEETSAAARNLLGEVATLTQQTARFETGSDTVGGGRAARAASTVVQTMGLQAHKSRRDMEGSPQVKRLPANAISALVRPDDDWKEF